MGRGWGDEGPYQAEELLLSLWTEVQVGKSQQHAAQVRHGDVLGSVQDVLGRSGAAEDRMSSQPAATAPAWL